MKRLIIASKRFVLVMLRSPREENAAKMKVLQAVISIKGEIQTCFQEFQVFFKEPKGLPPKREVKHEIQLQHDGPLPNIGLSVV